MIEAMAVSLTLTLALEGAFALAWGLRRRRELAVVALVNILTNPVVVVSYHTAVGLLGWPALPVTAALEGAAILTEWLFYRLCSQDLRRPLLFALLANALSYGTGCIINQL